ncbi:MAG: hypothetical protein CMQ20_08285 [Gammaproteobacteria bacterium]|nr:hypothetical protein [Gammaproteobacteria bacterium]
MARTTFLFYTNCSDPDREQELSDWYDQVHIPDVVSIPSFTSCTRYRLTGRQFGPAEGSLEVKATYLSIVECDLGADEAAENLASAAEDWQERGRMSNLFRVVASEIIAEENRSHA